MPDRIEDCRYFEVKSSRIWGIAGALSQFRGMIIGVANLLFSSQGSQFLDLPDNILFLRDRMPLQIAIVGDGDVQSR